MDLKGLSADGGISWEKIAQLVAEVVEAAPAIKEGVQSAAPYVQAIVDVLKVGGDPTPEQWAALRARLEDGSAQLKAQLANHPQVSADNPETSPAPKAEETVKKVDSSASVVTKKK